MFDVKTIQGKREYMEDYYAFLHQYGITVAMVCDGHGGDTVSKTTVKELPKKIINKLITVKGTNVKNAISIREVIMNWADEMKNEKSGSTLTGIAIKDGILYVYNLGDSRTVFPLRANSFIFMLKPVFHNGKFQSQILVDYEKPSFFTTIDHDPKNPVEITRIKESGGKIIGNRLEGILSLTRAFGDTDVKPGTVPDIFWTKWNNIAGPVLMYSDGLYETEKYNDMQLYKMAVNGGVSKLVNKVYEDGSNDNITALLFGV